MTYETRLGEAQVAVYLFHGVTRPHGCAVRNYTRKHLPLDYFAAVIRRLKQHGHAVSMDDVHQHFEANAPLPPRAFAVTFDDGFQNNFTVAAPVLKEEQVPATFYVTTGFLDGNRMGWIDRIEYAVEQRTRGCLRLPWGVRSFDGRAACRELLDEIRSKVKRDRDLDPDALATSIQEQLDVPITFSSEHPLDRKLTWDELRTLAAEPLFTVAGHSHSHRILAYLSDADLAQELDTSIGMLAGKADIRSIHYSYPEGLSFCYSDRVIEALKQRGVRCCPTAEDGTNGPGSDPFRLKRIMVT